jgi:hypothetical protein
MKPFTSLALVFAIFLLSLSSSPALAMHCTKGVPCGRACIPADHVCHKETPAGAAIERPKAPELAQEAASAAPLRPDPAKTPGDVLTTDPAVICVKGYTKTVRAVPESVREQVFRIYGIAQPRPGEVETDHLVALELGGSNSIRNLWPQSYWTKPLNAHTKDRLENKLHRLVCTGKLGLPEAQKAIAQDWIEAYRTYIGPLPE